MSLPREAEREVSRPDDLKRTPKNDMSYVHGGFNYVFSRDDGPQNETSFVNHRLYWRLKWRDNSGKDEVDYFDVHEIDHIPSPFSTFHP